MSVPIAPTDRVVLRMPRWLGDAVAAEPVLRAMAEFHREAGCAERLTVAAPMRLVMLFSERFPDVTWLPTDRSPADRPAGWRGNDVALLLTGSFRSAWLTWRAGVPVRCGWARDGRGLLLTHAPTPAKELGRVPLGLGIRGRRPRILPRPFGTACIELAHLLGVRVPHTRPELPSSAEGRAALKQRFERIRLGTDQPYIAVNVGARAGSAKGVPPAIWAQAIAKISESSELPVVVLSGPGERETLHDVLEQRAGGKTFPCADPLVDLPELVALAEGASVFVTADSGPRHVALATGTPVVAVCGPTDPRHTADHLEAQRVVRVEVPCGPCHLESCPNPPDTQLACMQGIDPAAIASATLELLEQSSVRS